MPLVTVGSAVLIAILLSGDLQSHDVVAGCKDGNVNGLEVAMEAVHLIERLARFMAR